MKKQSLLRWGMIVAVMLALIGVLLWRLYDLTILTDAVSIPAAFFKRTDAGGVLQINVKLLSS